MRAFTISCVAAVIVIACQRTEVQRSPSLQQIATIPLPGVRGRIDHLAFDPSTHRLFVAALGNNTVEVLETVKNAHLRYIAVPARGGESAEVRVFETDLQTR